MVEGYSRGWPPTGAADAHFNADQGAPMAYETIDLKIEDSVAEITLNRPERLNAWNDQLGRELNQAVLDDAADTGVRAVMITGAGRGFSSGADVKEMLERSSSDGQANGQAANVGDLLRERYHPIIKGIRELPKPVVAAVNGPAVGIGCSLALACDLIVAAESAVFGLAFVNIGLVPDGGSTVLVPAAVGKARALEMALLGDPVPASQALDWGLINRVAPDGKLIDEARALTRRLAAGPTRSYANSKRALNNSLFKHMDEQLELEAQIQGEMTGSADFLEGISAFVEKREPDFKGA
jgi:2-(1,2-epoxy-1,2-dihydrophenyl)acetyl-CoA isomerase